MSCNIGIHRAITKVLNNKPWFEYKEGDRFIKILDSPKKRINRATSVGVAKSLAITINNELNTKYPKIGTVLYSEFDMSGRGIVEIAPTKKQLDYINATEDAEIDKLVKEIELDNLVRETNQKNIEQNIDKFGDSNTNLYAAKSEGIVDYSKMYDNSTLLDELNIDPSISAKDFVTLLLPKLTKTIDKYNDNYTIDFVENGEGSQVFPGNFTQATEIYIDLKELKYISEKSNIPFDVVVKTFVLHEAAHAMSMFALEDGAVSTEIERLFDLVKKQIDKNPFNDVFRNNESLLGKEEGNSYNTKNVHEFVADSFANPYFKEYLSNIQDNKSNVFEKLINSILKFLGYKIKYSVYNKIMSEFNSNKFQHSNLVNRTPINQEMYITYKAIDKNMVDRERLKLKERNYTNESIQEGLEWAKKIFPKANINIVRGFVDSIARGSYNTVSDLIHVSEEYANKGTIKHEVGHNIFNWLSKSEQEKLLDEGSKLFGIPRGESKTNIKFSIPISEILQYKEIAKKFKDDILEFKDNPNADKFKKHNHKFKLGNPSSVLLKAGVPNKPIILDQEQIIHLLHPRHNINLDIISNFVQAIQNPILISKNRQADTRRPGVDVYIDIKGLDGKHINVILTFGLTSETLEVVKVTTSFEDEDVVQRLNEAIKRNEILDIDKERSPFLFRGSTYHTQMSYHKNEKDYNAKLNIINDYIKNYSNTISKNDRDGVKYMVDNINDIKYKGDLAIEEKIMEQLEKSPDSHNHSTVIGKFFQSIKEFLSNIFNNKNEVQNFINNVNKGRYRNLSKNNEKSKLSFFEFDRKLRESLKNEEIISRENDVDNLSQEKRISRSTVKPEGNRTITEIANSNLSKYDKTIEIAKAISDIFRTDTGIIGSMAKEVNLVFHSRDPQAEKQGGFAFQYGKNIVFDITSLLTELNDNNDYSILEEKIRTAILEELIHYKASELLDDNTIDNIFNELTQKDINNIMSYYTLNGNSTQERSFPPYVIVHEYVRQVTQHLLEGKTAEEIQVQYYKVLSPLINFLKKLFTNIIGIYNRDKTSIGSKTIDQLVSNIRNQAKSEGWNITEPIRNQSYSSQLPILTEEQFKEYFINNKQEFATSIAKNKDVMDSFKRKMEGIDFVFSQSPELASIGSKAQYLQYLSTIFPDSKVKDIVYHGTLPQNKFEKFDKQKGTNLSGEYGGIHFGDLTAAIERPTKIVKAESFLAGIEEDLSNFKPNIIPVILNIENIKRVEEGKNWGQGDWSKLISKENEADGYVYTNKIENKGKDSYVVFEPEQIHVMGGKNDIQGFKDFTQGKQFQKLTAEEKTKTIEQFVNNRKNENFNNISNNEILEDSFNKLLEEGVFAQKCTI